MRLERNLDSIEMLMKEWTPVHVIGYEGQVNEDVLCEAYSILCSRHPVLRASIEADSQDTYKFCVSPGSPARFESRDVEDFELSAELLNRFNEERGDLLDREGGVCWLSLIRGKTKGYVAIRINHAIADAPALWGYLDELWKIYTALSAGVEVSIAPRASLPISPAQLIDERWVRSPEQERVQASNTVASGVKNCSGFIISCTVRPHVQLSRWVTTKIIELAHANKTSVHGIVCGAIMMVLRTYSSPNGPVPMICSSVVNLRNRVVPAISATGTSNLLGSHYAKVMVPSGANPIAIGKQIKTQLDSGLARRELRLTGHRWSNSTQSEFASVAESGPLNDRLRIASITNPGVAPNFAAPSELRFVEYLVLDNNRDRARRRFPYYGAVTFGGRLTIHVQLPFGFDNGSYAQHCELIRQELTNIVSN